MIKKAAAVKGDIEHKKAQVLSSATGSLAEEMLKIAKEHNINIHQDANLAEVLSTLEVYENLDDDLYEAVSSILQELYIINKNLP